MTKRNDEPEKTTGYTVSGSGTREQYGNSPADKGMSVWHSIPVERVVKKNAPENAESAMPERVSIREREEAVEPIRVLPTSEEGENVPYDTKTRERPIVSEAPKASGTASVGQSSVRNEPNGTRQMPAVPNMPTSRAAENTPSGTRQMPAVSGKNVYQIAAAPSEPQTRQMPGRGDAEAFRARQGSASQKQGQPRARSSQDTPISLDDFNREGGSTAPTAETGRKKKRSLRGSAGFGFLRLVLYVAFVGVCVWFLSNTVWNIANDVFAFVKEEKEVVVTIPEGATTADVAKILYEADVIDYPRVFTAFCDFRISRRSYLTGDYISGSKTVRSTMNFDTLLDELSDYRHVVTGTVRITIPEGLTVNETLRLLEENGVANREDFTEALQEFAYEYRFAGLLTPELLAPERFDTDISYRLEGYLFPDTYEFYLGENPISVLDRFLMNFDKKFEEDFYNRCEELGMTVDEVITLASLIEKEGNNANDYYLISSVFHNRLKHADSFPFLNSDASLQYSAASHLELSEIDTSVETPYNTYINRGLPPGPICNPGIEAIYAALYPEETGYYYFYTKKNGETVYSYTQGEHQNYVNADK